MPARDVVVHSLGEFIDLVTPSEPDRQTGRRRDFGVYRGASNASAPLLSTLDRLGGDPHKKSGLEEHILRNFIRYSRAHLDAARPHNDWEMLVTAQHHGVPTRLLDWTYSPLVAAFFATGLPTARTNAIEPCGVSIGSAYIGNSTSRPSRYWFRTSTRSRAGRSRSRHGTCSRRATGSHSHA
ncbi:MAG: FRG domain-containing protein [Gemmatimonadaceae bacterium]